MIEMSNVEPVFKTVWDELKYWKQQAISYKNKYKQLMKLHRMSEDDDEDGCPKAKRFKIIKLFQDPLSNVADDKISFNVLQYFRGKELLRLSEVSRSWKTIVERYRASRDLHDVKLVIKNEFSKKDLGILIANRRIYKHLELIDCFEEEHQLIKRFSSSLESLKIKDTANFHRISQKTCYFPNLRKLVLSHFDSSWLFWLSSCHFSESLIELRLTNSLTSTNQRTYDKLHDEWIDNVTELLDNLPSIQHLYMRCDDAAEVDLEDYFNETHFMLESADFGSNYPRIFLTDQFDTLKRLRAGSSTMDIESILARFNNLEVFAFDYIDDTEDEEEEEDDNEVVCVGDEYYVDRKYSKWAKDELIDIPIHTNIKTLKIRIDNDFLFQEIIKALPSLETLIVYQHTTKFDLEFLASTAMNLKKLVCRGMTHHPYLLDAYEHMQKFSSEDYANLNFELSIEYDQLWKDEDCLWDDELCKIVD